MKNRLIQLPELVAELQAQNLQKRDFVVPAKCISMVDGQLVVSNSQGNEALDKLLTESGIAHEGGSANTMTLKPLDVCHNNIVDKLGIPKKYYDKMKGGHEGLLDHNVSYWFQDNGSKNYFLRTFVDAAEQEGYARALLSDRFRVIDNYDVLLACLEAVKESGANVEIQHCDITERKMYVRFVAPEIEIQSPELLKNYKVPNGSPNQGSTGICTGFVISNSEVGQGQFSISPRAVVLACSNGMIWKDDAFSRNHLGTKMDEYSSIDWSESTKRKNYELIIAQVKDAIKTFCSEDYLGNRIAKLEEAGAKELEHPIDAVKNVTKSLSISEEKEQSILDFFMKGKDFTGFGVSQALTYYAHTEADADEQYELEMASVDVVGNMEQFDKPLAKKSTRTASKLN